MRTNEIVTASGIEITDDDLVIRLADCEVRIRWEQCSPILAAATPKQLRQAELSPGGQGIHWPLLDEDLSGELTIFFSSSGQASQGRECGYTR
jgi:hypothetical protein